ncbi:hypothetical protein U5801_25455 [Lamprobacter modestohalophilus]|uniref:hypothetical protein n=2 Tax=Lamprobacter modestohalophilus TaxID=1064514 RepID=UPI002ADEF977|nr:hypothetical protein [Lamprobacter modestohalophilus]MEA1053128.1 hypothetical protein [Lamprobacter modestohalophilus]
MIELPPIPETERTALIDELVRLIETLAEQTQQQTETIQQLRDEIARLKGEKGKPRFKPSGMEQKAGQGEDQQGDEDPSKGTRKRPGSSKRAKTAQLSLTALMEPPMIGLMEPHRGGSQGSRTGAIVRQF